jgi:glucose-1-phosphate cytidylyltransferase
MNDLSAIILCGGKGMRLRPLTEDIPKPLIEINGKPVLFYIINHLLKYGVNEIIIAAGYKSNMVKDFMSKNFSDINYCIVDSGDAAIIDRIKDCIPKVSKDFILCYGDTICDVNINKLIDFHKEESNKVTITSYPISIPFGVMKTGPKDIVLKFEEKPVLDEVMNIGYCIFPKNIFSIFKEAKSLVDVYNTLVSKSLLRCYKHTKIHITINTISELEYAERNIKKVF